MCLYDFKMPLKEQTSTTFCLPSLDIGSTAGDKMIGKKLTSESNKVSHQKTFLPQTTFSTKLNKSALVTKEVNGVKKEDSKLGKMLLDVRLNAGSCIENVLPVANNKTLLVGVKDTSLDESNAIKKINWKSLREPSDMYYDTMKLLKQTSLSKSLFELYCWAARNTQSSTDINSDQVQDASINHARTPIRKTKVSQGDVVPLLRVDGQRFIGAEPTQMGMEEYKVIDAKIRKFTRAQWKTPGEISILMGKEKNKLRTTASSENPATLQCFASEMHKVWRSSTSINKDVEPNLSHQHVVKRPIHPTVQPQSLVGLAGMQSPSKNLIMQEDADSPLVIKNLPTKRGKKHRRNRHKEETQSLGSGSHNGSIDSNCSSSNHSGHPDSIITDSCKDKESPRETKFPRILNPTMTTNIVTSIQPLPHPQVREPQSKPVDRPRRRPTRTQVRPRAVRGVGAIGGGAGAREIREMRHMVRHTVVIPGPPPASPTTPLTLPDATDDDSLAGFFDGDVIDRVQAANSPDNDCLPGTSHVQTGYGTFSGFKLPDISERQPMVQLPFQSGPASLSRAGLADGDQDTDLEPRSESSTTRRSTSVCTQLESDLDDT